MPVYCALKRYTVPTTPLRIRGCVTPSTTELAARVTGVVTRVELTVATVMSGVPGPAGSTTVSVTSALFTLPAALDATTR